MEAAAHSIKSYRYERGGKVVHLLSNTDDKAPAVLRAPKAVTDVCRNIRHAAGADIALPPGQYLLAEEE
jgi:hypothetical protein